MHHDDVKSRHRSHLSLWSGPSTQQVSGRVTSPENLKLLREAMLNDMDTALASAYPEDRERLRVSLGQQVDAFIKDRVKKAGESAVAKPNFGRVLQKAQRKALAMRYQVAQTTLRTAREKAPDPLPRAGLSRTDHAGKPGVNVIRQAPPVRNLVLSGGGGKGLVYGAVMAELERHQALGEVRSVAGSSAGALAATFLGVGGRAKNLAAAVEETNLKETQGGFDKYAAYYPSFPTEKSGPAARLGKSGQMALYTLDTRIAGIVADYLVGLDKAKDPRHAELVDRLGPERIAALQKPVFAAKREQAMFSFRDLAAFHAVDPDRFKDLHLMGWDTFQNKGVLMNSRNTPDLPVAVAARISMAHPLVYAGIVTNVHRPFAPEVQSPAGVPTPESMRRAYRDGGIAENTPVSPFVRLDAKHVAPVDPEADGDALAQTLVFVFDEGGDAHQVMHVESPAAVGQRKPPMGAVSVSGNDGYAEVVTRDYRYSQLGPGVQVVHQGALTTLSVEPDPELLGDAMLEARVHAAEQLAQRVNQATYNHFSLSEEGALACYKKLSLQEKQALLGYDKRKDVVAGRSKDGKQAPSEANPAAAFMVWLQKIARADAALKPRTPREAAPAGLARDAKSSVAEEDGEVIRWKPYQAHAEHLRREGKAHFLVPPLGERAPAAPESIPSVAGVPASASSLSEPLFHMLLTGEPLESESPGLDSLPGTPVAGEE